LELDQLYKWVAKGYCTEKEAFFMLWSAKEAVLKATGLGLSFDPRHIEIHFPKQESSEWETILDGVVWQGSYQLIKFNFASYAFSWCGFGQAGKIQFGKGISLLNK